MGFERYLRCRESPAEMASKAIRDTLGKTDLAPGEIDILLYASEYAHDESEGAWIHALCLDNGLVNAFPIGIRLNFCGNLGSCFRIANQMLSAGSARNIIIVTADSTTESGPDSRLLEPFVAVTSDGAASCIISTRGLSPLRLTGTHEHVDHAMSRMDVASLRNGSMVNKPEFFHYSLDSYRGRKKTFQDYYRRSGLSSEDISFLITNNYGVNTLAGFASEAGLGIKQVFGRRTSEVGHVQSADSLLNLEDLVSSGALRVGDRILMLSTGPYSWSLCGMRYGN